MTPSRLILPALLLLQMQAAVHAAPVSFTRDLAPILADKCVTCHEEKKAKGRYRVDTFELVGKAGSSDEPSLTPGKPDASTLYTRLVSHDEDERMPQKDDPLPPAQIALFKQWIEEGGKFDGPDPKTPLAELLAASKKEAPATPEKYPRPVPVTALVFAPDGRSYFSSGYHEVQEWSASDGSLRRRLAGAPERVLAIAAQQTGDHIAAAGGTPGRSGEVVILSRASGKVVHRLPNAKDTILAAAFSPDGLLLAVGGADNLIRVFRTTDWKQAWKAEAHADWITFLAFAPDGQHLVSTSRDRTARIFTAAKGEPGITFTNHSSAVTCAAWNAEGKFVYTSSADGEVRRWQWDSEVDGGGKAKDTVLKGGRQEVTRIAMAGPRLLSASADGRIRSFQVTVKIVQPAPEKKLEAKEKGKDQPKDKGKDTDLAKKDEAKRKKEEEARKKQQPKEVTEIDTKELATFGHRVDALAVDGTSSQAVFAGQEGKLRLIQLPDNKVLLERTAAPGW
ncbi:anaphase-promoting complex subunit 4 [Roseimicrobium gellanilyticum]|uniref:Anaphase-promoting complex subunit 4 n=1 Tax=Roseimicrobium gellanilyticum TaxID=748857 RepID=A0A366HS53_9BACT|nr:c-type cytochrome domain-containing protein [Roseimicrobium gellanilyticum]RBP46511.1 anaphase-promoting complex subunit 4 [Roseimicrobium gellanilyticum]